MKLSIQQHVIRLGIVFLLFPLLLVSISAVSLAATTVFVGDIYGGGIVFYILKPGDPGFISGQEHGLIAATSDIMTKYTDASEGRSYSGEYYWSTGQSETANDSDYAFQQLHTGTAIGQGALNTRKILVKYPPNRYPNSAAAVAAAYRGGGYCDWFLPSKEELSKLTSSNGIVCGISQHVYWSSSEYSAANAWFHNFTISQQGYFNKSYHLSVRAIRAF